ncbi:Cytochrome c family protein [Minicystis rosea]|nr:Cytochrome c family protein [Minicystis rosea]
MALVALTVPVVRLARAPSRSPAPRERLLPETADISRAHERPRDPFRDPIAGNAARAEEIKIGYLLFTQTFRFAGAMVASDMACSHCHLNAGQRLGALPLVGVAHAYPAPNVRAGRPFTLEDRIVGCLLRSANAANGALPRGRIAHENGGDDTFPSPRSFEVRAIAAYLEWISEGVEATPWRGRDTIPAEARIPVSELSVAKGEKIYGEKCSPCHGAHGEGVQIGWLKPGPLWGDRSWNDGAGLARTYTLAGFLRHAMPYTSPGQLRDDEAQHLAAFITSKPRPVFREKTRDYPDSHPPEDAVYYAPRNPLTPSPAIPDSTKTPRR